MKIWYDLEFLEDGRTIEPISIGIVDENGREFYAVFEEIETNDALKERIRAHRWLMENVVPHLPLREERGYEFSLVTGNSGKYGNFWLDNNLIGLTILPRRAIRNQVREFLLGSGEPVELWSFGGAYDHVALSQLWGRMVDKPEGLPWWTNDIQQLAKQLGLDTNLPPNTSTEHNALADARWHREAWTFLEHMRTRTKTFG